MLKKQYLRENPQLVAVLSKQNNNIEGFFNSLHNLVIFIRFQFLQSHWHWGSSDAQGSEHKVEGKSFPMELHLVHWNKKYSSVEEAVNKEDGLAVIAFLYQVLTLV